jgi:2'-5' RNA ligase
MQEKRLFVAVPLPAEIKNALRALPGAMQSDALRLVPAENWHLTVLFLGNVGS